jgi:hypothetical protein
MKACWKLWSVINGVKWRRRNGEEAWYQYESNHHRAEN